MKAIETKYKGYRFRSRLEARWAVFFDALGVVWEYEPEGFELGGGVRYLPDFRIQYVVDGHPCAEWVEVKADAPTTEEIAKLSVLCRQQKMCGTVLYGTPGAHGLVVVSAAKCSAHDVGTDSAALNLAATVRAWRGFADELRVEIPRVRGAIIGARGARFEFGESGARA